MEVMVTTVILTVGLVAIYRAFFTSLDTIFHLSCRTHALILLENKLATAERDFRTLKDFDIGALSETLLINNKPVEFFYTIQLIPVENLLSVFCLDITISWQEPKGPLSLSRSAYFSGITTVDSGG